MSSTFDGRWVKTIVLMSPIRAAMRAADSDDTAASRLAAKKIAPSVAGPTPNRDREPEGHQGLRDEPAGEGVEREQGRQPGDDPARATEAEPAADAVLGRSRAAASIAGPQRPGDGGHAPARWPRSRRRPPGRRRASGQPPSRSAPLSDPGESAPVAVAT